MISLELAAATVATAGSVGGIMAVYVTVLRKTGWIGKSANHPIQPAPKEKPTHNTMRKNEPPKTKSSDSLEKRKITRSAAKQKNHPSREAELNKKAVLKQKLAQTLIEAKKSSEAYEIPRRCTHHFGYLYSLEKDDTIPDECYSCSTLIQCFQEPKRISG